MRGPLSPGGCLPAAVSWRLPPGGWILSPRPGRVVGRGAEVLLRVRSVRHPSATSEGLVAGGCLRSAEPARSLAVPLGWSVRVLQYRWPPAISLCGGCRG